MLRSYLPLMPAVYLDDFRNGGEIEGNQVRLRSCF